MPTGRPEPDPAHGPARFFYAAQFFYGGWFLFHGLNWWLGYFPERSFAPDARGLIPELIRSGLFDIVKLIEVGVGLALLADRFAALAVIVALPITLVIAYVNLSKGSPFGISVGVVIIALNLLMAFGHLDRYLPMLAMRAGSPNMRGWQAWPRGPQPSFRGETLPTGVVVAAALIGIAAAASVTYASIYFAAPTAVRP